MTTIDLEATRRTRARYQRIAPLYDLMEGVAERRYTPWRRRLWSLVRGPRVLEVGVGTGKNMPFYPSSCRITAVDLTPGMFERARARGRRLSVNNVTFRLGDVQALEFDDASFETALATFVFCSVPDPILGLRELRRVVEPGGQLLLLEHMRSPKPVVGWLMDAINPLVVRMMGANINRPTLHNIEEAGWRIEAVEDLALGGIFKSIQASAIQTINRR